MRSILVKVLLFSTVALATVSCKKDNDGDSNQISDSQGVNIKLNWTLTDGSTAVDGADIDFYVYKGIGAAKELTPVIYADNSGAFEDEDFLSSLTDGDYTIEVDYFDIGKNGKFNLVVKAIGGDKTYSINDNGFTTANDGDVIDFARITKSGSNYTVSKL